MSECGEILVEIDRDFLPVVPGYLENRCSECTLIPELLDGGRFDEIRVLGHRMKGSGGSYGFDEISEIGEELESAALHCDATRIRLAIDCLQRYLDSVTVAYV
jgi:chemotaxis protein histidine kinase CheA